MVQYSGSNVLGQAAISGLKGGLAFAQTGPALIRMVGHDGLPEDLLEIIDGELQIALGDGHVRVSQRLLHEVLRQFTVDYRLVIVALHAHPAATILQFQVEPLGQSFPPVWV